MIVLVSLIVLLACSHCFSHSASLHQHSFSRMIFTLVSRIFAIYWYLVNCQLVPFLTYYHPCTCPPPLLSPGQRKMRTLVMPMTRKATRTLQNTATSASSQPSSGNSAGTVSSGSLTKTSNECEHIQNRKYRTIVTWPSPYTTLSSTL